MSRIAKAPIQVASAATLTIDGQLVTVKGPKGEQSLSVQKDIVAELNDGIVTVKPLNENCKKSWAMAGTMRALINNMQTGVIDGFTKKLTLIGVGYRAKSKGKVLELSLGFSHPVQYQVPEGVTIETPSQTEIVVTSSDKQQVGQVAAKIRAYRPPEPYKGKGVRYSDEEVIRKEAKKK